MEDYQLGFSSSTDNYSYKAKKGLSEELVKEISLRKKEPRWMLEIRLQALKQYLSMPIPDWGASLVDLHWDDLRYYLKPVEKPYQNWDEVPDSVRKVFDLMGVPEAEKSMLAGVGGQYDSEVIYHSLQDLLAKKGVLFLSMDEGLKQYPEIVRKYFGKIVPPGDNKLAALNTAVWSGGSFVYVPKGVRVDLPLQAYFRINAENAGQFERTMIIVEEAASAHYIEGCSAPAFASASLHAAVVEVIVEEGAKMRYTTVQNWYKTVYNLVTKRAIVAKDGVMEWVDCNLGSKVTMKYPSCLLMGERACGEMLSISVAGAGQHQDTGAKMIHLAPNTTSRIVSKSISKNGGRSSYRGQIKMVRAAEGAHSKVVCDALILDHQSRSDTYPNNQILNGSSTLEHEAYVSRVSEEQILYLMSRGLTQKEAEGIIIRGFLEPIIQELPMEYAVELNRLIKLEMVGSVG
ncbi:MAG: Protein SufB [Microgenomates group bacterium GW2011_GWA2_46_7]|nr:MAG: Protein SufB [Microgenomates group bacterium GW2011_GWA2_46_7]